MEHPAARKETWRGEATRHASGANTNTNRSQHKESTTDLPLPPVEHPSARAWETQKSTTNRRTRTKGTYPRTTPAPHTYSYRRQRGARGTPATPVHHHKKAEHLSQEVHPKTPDRRQGKCQREGIHQHHPQNSPAQAKWGSHKHPHKMQLTMQQKAVVACHLHIPSPATTLLKRNEMKLN